MTTEINLEKLNREEYINLELMIIYAFKLNYGKFTEEEKKFLKHAIDKSLYECNERI